MSSIRENIQHLQAELKEFPQAKLVVVTKSRTVLEIQAALSAGVDLIAENRVQEAVNKFASLPLDVEKHLIGHLQSNKAAEAVKLFDLIQSVDSLKITKSLEQAAAKLNKILPILIQINISHDPAKHGVKPEEAKNFLRHVSTLSHLKVKGLMTIPKLTEDPEETRHYFRTLKKLFETMQAKTIPGIELEHLSMGMSDDYRLALEEGSTMIRLGRKVFEG